MLKNKTNDKCYIGQTTKTFKERFRQHQTSNSIIGKALRKYGSENFEKIILENISNDLLSNKEIELIKENNSISPNGYNLTIGGEKPPSRKRIPRSEETKKKISESHKGKEVSKKTREKMSESFKGRKFSKKTREKMSESRMGHNVSKETRKKISEANKGRASHRKGKHLSEEHKRRISEAHKKRHSNNC